MGKGRIAAVFLLGSAGAAGLGAAGAAAGLGGEAGRSAALGVGFGWLGTAAGFAFLVWNLEGSQNRFLAAWAAGFLLRLGFLAGAFGLAASGLGRPVPLLLGMAFTVFGLLVFEGAVLWGGAKGKGA